MSAIRIRRGFDVPLPGRPDAAEPRERLGVRRVALLPPESHGIQVKMLVQAEDPVRLGQGLFCDRKDPEAVYGSPAAGRVVAVHRGARRAVLAVEIEVSEGEADASPGTGQIDLDLPSLDGITREQALAGILAMGLFPSLRQRPYDTVAHSKEVPGALFVTAMDTSPLAPSPRKVLAGREFDFQAGLRALSVLPGGKTFVCTSTAEDWTDCLTREVEHRTFEGPHPAGNAGVHIHELYPVGASRKAWHIGYQDVADIGAAFRTGVIPSTRIISIGGPACTEPQLIRTRRGAAIAELCGDLTQAEEPRFVSGSALSGTTAEPGTPSGFLGRFVNQVTVLEDRTRRELLSWALPVAKRHTLTNTLLDKFLGRPLRFDTDTNGSHRAIVPIGSWEQVMPMDILATQLIKALASNDLESAEKLGALELAEEDLALCEYVDPSKTQITHMLREMLTRIQKEG